MALHYFFYGTLLDADVRRSVLGAMRSPQGLPARLDGFVRVRVPGKSHPTVIAGDGVVEGLLFAGLTPRQREHLAVFEGNGYHAAPLPVSLAAGISTLARVFVLRRPPQRAEPWSLDRWQRVDKARFLAALSGIRARMPARALRPVAARRTAVSCRCRRAGRFRQA